MYKESGIYCYRNKINGKLYVGQAKNLRHRYLGFLNSDRRYAGQIMENARKKYGVDNFEYSILTHCPVDELNYWEAFYVERLNCVTPHGYNMTNGGDSVYTSTKEFKEKQTVKLKEKILSKNSNLDVTKVEYVGKRIPVTIVCPIHGPFKKTPDYFDNPEINDLCCPKCVRENIRQKSEDRFFKEAKKKWGNKYDYSKTIITDRMTPITITCPIHGDFTVLPGNHICKDKNTGGCQKCSEERQHIESLEKGSIKLLKRIKKKFGEKYSLDKFEYKGDKEKVTLICPVHGEFSMRPSSLLKSHGCPKCSGFYMDEDYFIEISKKVHGEKYDYSKVKYQKAKEDVCIICPEHGEFWQTPRVHMDGSGCPICGCLKASQNRRRTTEDFIGEAKLIHGNKYDYSKTEYVNYDTKVCIICSEHGEFWQTPASHLNGAGCLQCSKNAKRKTKEQFIKEAIEIHGDKYDYSKVNYINNATKVCLVCPKHGEFWVTPGAHLRNGGCRKCREENFQITPNEKFINKVNELYPNRYTFEKCNYRNKTTFVTLFDTVINDYISVEPDELIRRTPKTIELIKMLKEKFGDVYDYSKVKYITDKTPICIICPTHGEFSMTYNNLLKSKGCPKCTLENAYRTKHNGETNKTVFIEQSRKVHGDKYDYSKVDYKHQHQKVCIICPEHGEFYQKPNAHLSGFGCPKCGQKYTGTRKTILQFDLNDNFIQEWENYDAITNKLGFKMESICSCCTGKKNTAYGFKWKHKEDNTVNPTILQLTKDNVLVREWKDMPEIHKAKPINSTQHITKCLQGYMKTAGGFIWKYKEE